VGRIRYPSHREKDCEQYTSQFWELITKLKEVRKYLAGLRGELETTQEELKRAYLEKWESSEHLRLRYKLDDLYDEINEAMREEGGYMWHLVDLELKMKGLGCEQTPWKECGVRF